MKTIHYAIVDIFRFYRDSNEHLFLSKDFDTKKEAEDWSNKVSGRFNRKGFSSIEGVTFGVEKF